MSNKRIILLLAVFLIGVSLGIVWRAHSRAQSEPSYQGRTVSSWMKELSCQKGFAELWTNGPAEDPQRLLILTAALDQKDSSFQKLWLRVWPRLPTWAKSHFSGPIPDDNVRAAAAAGISSTKQYYKPAIPKLIALVTGDQKPFVRFFAIRALGTCLGAEDRPDEAEEAAAMSALVKAFKDPQFSSEAAAAMKQIDPINGNAILNSSK